METTTLAPKKRERRACAKAQTPKTNRTQLLPQLVADDKASKKASGSKAFVRTRQTVERAFKQFGLALQAVEITDRPCGTCSALVLLVTRAEEPALFGCKCGFTERLRRLEGRP
jgi:hypothetical protein